MINIVVLMAGLGSRFQGEGPFVPKPLIEVLPGRRMVDLVIDWLRPPEPHRFVFVCLAEHHRQFDFAATLAGVAGGTLVLAEALTSGPAATALLASAHFDTDDELLIAYCDSFLTVPIETFLAHNRRLAADGGVLVYPSDATRDSYAELDAQGRVLRTAEKQVLSPHATAGFYYFRRGRDYAVAARRLIASEANAGQEVFVCPVMNELIAAGKLVVSYPISRAERIEMGTPEDLALARARLAGDRLPSGAVAS